MHACLTGSILQHCEVCSVSGIATQKYHELLFSRLGSSSRSVGVVVQNLIVPSNKSKLPMPCYHVQAPYILMQGQQRAFLLAATLISLGLNPGHPTVPHLAIYRISYSHSTLLQCNLSRYQIPAASSVLSAKNGQNPVADLLVVCMWWGAKPVDNLAYRNKCAISLRYTSSTGSGTVRS